MPRPSLATSALVAVVACLGLLVLPGLFGYGTLVVQSASMAETAPVGSLVLTRPLQAPDVRVADVILLRHQGAAAPAPVLHRVTSLTYRADEVIVTTKGDSNAAPDPNPFVLRGATVTPVLAVPHVGRALTAARTPLGWTLVIALPATMLLWLQMRAIWFPPPRHDESAIADENVPSAA